MSVLFAFLYTACSDYDFKEIQEGENASDTASSNNVDDTGTSSTVTDSGDTASSTLTAKTNSFHGTQEKANHWSDHSVTALSE